LLGHLNQLLFTAAKEVNPDLDHPLQRGHNQARELLFLLGLAPLALGLGGGRHNGRRESPRRQVRASTGRHQQEHVVDFVCGHKGHLLLLEDLGAEPHVKDLS